jgi:hypothetical protein
MSDTTVAGGEVEVDEMTRDQGRDMLERTAREKFDMSWDEFYAAYQSGRFVGSNVARVAEELAFLAPFAR